MEQLDKFVKKIQNVLLPYLESLEHTIRKVLKNKYFAKFSPFIFLFSLPLLIFSNIIFNKTHSFYIAPDNTDQFYAWYQKLASSIHSGYLPLWDANAFSGHNFIGEIQTGVFYPINIIWVTLFGSTDGIDIYLLELIVILHFLIGSIGMYLLARNFGLSKFAAILSAIVFVYIGTPASRVTGQTSIFYGLALLPFALYFASRFVKSGRYRDLILTGGVMGVQFLAGHIQPVFHTLILVVAYFIYSTLREQGKMILKLRKIVINIIITGIVIAIVSLPQLILSVQYLRNAYRWVNAGGPITSSQKVPFSNYAYDYIIEPSQFAGNLFDNKNFGITEGNTMFIGVLFTVFLIIGLIIAFKRRDFGIARSNVVFLSLVALTALIIAFGHHTFVSAIMYYIPFMTQVRQPGRYVILIHLFVTLMAGVGAMYVQRYQPDFKKTYRYIIGVILGFFFLNAIYMLLRDSQLNYMTSIQIFLLLAVLVVFIYLPKRLVALKTVLILGLIVANIFILRFNAYGEIGHNTYYPTRFFKKTAIMDYLEKQYPYYRVYVKDGATSNNIGYVFDIQTKLGYGATMHKTYFDFISQDWDIDGKVNDLLNVRYIISNKIEPDLKLIMHDQDTKTYLYERYSFYPKVFSRSFLDTKEEDTIINSELLEYKDMYIKYKIDTTKSDEIIFSEINYPGWQIFVNGERAELKSPQIDNLIPILRSTTLEKGEHVVEMIYKPFYLF